VRSGWLLIYQVKMARTKTNLESKLNECLVLEKIIAT